MSLLLISGLWWLSKSFRWGLECEIGLWKSLFWLLLNVIGRLLKPWEGLGLESKCGLLNGLLFGLLIGFKGPWNGFSVIMTNPTFLSGSPCTSKNVWGSISWLVVNGLLWVGFFIGLLFVLKALRLGLSLSLLIWGLLKGLIDEPSLCDDPKLGLPEEW